MRVGGQLRAGGYYDFGPTGDFVGDAFVVTETYDTWGSAEEVSGLVGLNGGRAGTTFMS